MSNKRLPNISIAEAKIIFKNFSGLEGQFNTKGNRNFCVLLDDDNAARLTSDGWNVKWLEPKEEDMPRQAYLSVKVAFGQYPPKVILVSGGKQTQLSESTVSLLDTADIEYVDVIINPYRWHMNGKTGVKAYLKTMYVVIAKDDFAHKYEKTPGAESALSCVLGPDGNCIE